MESSNGADVEAEAAESTSATGTAINTNNQDNKRAAEESDGAQQPSASKKQRRNTRKKRGRAETRAGEVNKRAQKRNAQEAGESDEREAGGGAEGKPDAD